MTMSPSQLLVIISLVVVSDRLVADDTILFGKALFFDPRLSKPQGQACAHCHQPEHAYAHRGEITSVASDEVLYGRRNTPGIVYSVFSPPFKLDPQTNQYRGGLSWDGRFDSLEEQSMASIVDPLEMGNSDMAMWYQKVQRHYASELKAAQNGEDLETGIQIALSALAAFMQSDGFANRFSSKFDRVLANAAVLSDAEQRGLALFNGKAKCANCHTSQGQQDRPPLFTNHGFANVGTPKQLNNLYYYLPPAHNPEGRAFVDDGLAENQRVKHKDANNGRFKVPSLRNVSLTSPYMHNGAFKSLRTAVAFHANRHFDTSASPPETSTNLNTTNLPDSPLSKREIDDIVSFLHTLTDELR